MKDEMTKKRNVTNVKNFRRRMRDKGFKELHGVYIPDDKSLRKYIRNMVPKLVERYNKLKGLNLGGSHDE